MKPNENAHHNAIALSILILQLIAWAVTASSLYGDYSSSDAAGNGMARGFTLMFVVVSGIAIGMPVTRHPYRDLQNNINQV